MSETSKAGPTPGPWGWYWRQVHGKAECGVFAEPERGHAYSVCRAPKYAAKEEWEANARLIAAAPDLLEALSDLLGEAEEGIATCPLTRDKARAAIAKAVQS